jgi:hypothetical protein
MSYKEMEEEWQRIGKGGVTFVVNQTSMVGSYSIQHRVISAKIDYGIWKDGIGTTRITRRVLIVDKQWLCPRPKAQGPKQQSQLSFFFSKYPIALEGDVEKWGKQNLRIEIAASARVTPTEAPWDMIQNTYTKPLS